ncbi:MAG: M56 family metallopeptidase, partial [Pirellulaceae bacterium]|nr:M56 family metallopeptidase [Pirellulaceae bacterium]
MSSGKREADHTQILQSGVATVAPVADSVEGPVAAEPVAESDNRKETPAAEEAPEGRENRLGELRQRSTQYWFHEAAPFVVVGYLSGVLLLLGKLALGIHGGWNLRRRAELAGDAQLLSAVANRAKTLKMRFAPTVLYSRDVMVPTVVGILRPAILLPFSLATGLTAEQVEAVLTHELVHIRRYDHLINLMQRVVEALFFFHPAVWWLSRRIRIERENCCDDIVVALGYEPAAYAESLIKIAEQSNPRTRHALHAGASLTATGRISQLGGRVRRLLGASQREPLRLTRGGIAALSAFAIVGVAILLHAYADKQDDSPKADVFPANSRRRVVHEPNTAAPAANEGVIVRGTVLATPGGDGVGKVELVLHSNSKDQDRTTRTAADGSYSFDRVPIGVYGVGFKRSTGAWAPGAILRVATDDVRAGDLHLELPQGVSGTIRDAETGKPVAAARILFRMENGRDGSVLSDNQGKYRLYLPPGKVKVESQGTQNRYYPANFTTQSGESRTIEISKGMSSVDFQLRSAAKITGRILLPNGKPAAGYSVTAIVDWFRGTVQAGERIEEARTRRENGKTALQSPIFAPAEILETEISAGTGQTFRVRTDPLGRCEFYLRRPMPSRHDGEAIDIVVSVRSPDLAAAAAHVIKTTSFDTLPKPLEIRLEASGSAEFSVEDSNGKSLDNAEPYAAKWLFEYKLLSGELPNVDPRFRRIGQGRFRAEGLIPFWGYGFLATAKGYRGINKLEPISVEPGKTIDAGKLRLQRWDRSAAPRLIRQLGHKKSSLRESACHQLASLGPEALLAMEALLDRLNNDSVNSVRFSAAEALGKIGPAAKSAVPSLIDAVRNDRLGVDREAARALGLIGDPAGIEVLRVALSKPDLYVRRAAVAAAAKLSEVDSRAVPIIVAALNDKHYLVNADAAGALAEIGPAAQSAVPRLIELLKGRNSGCRANAAKALGRLGDPAALPALRVALKEDDSLVFTAAATAIAQISRGETTQGAQVRLRTTKVVLKNVDAKIRSGLLELSKKFRQLRNTNWGSLEQRVAGKSSPGEISVGAGHFPKGPGKSNGTTNPLPRKDQYSVMVVLKPMGGPVEQFEYSSIFPGIGLKGIVETWANDAELNSALEELVADSLAPLKELDQSVGWSAPTRVKNGTGWRVRLRPIKTHWTRAETPEMTVDLWNDSDQTFLYSDFQQALSLEIDGQSYRWADEVAIDRPVQAVAGRRTRNGAIRMSLGQSWARKDVRPPRETKDIARLKLAPGKHSIRISLAARPAEEGDPVQLISKPVEIEITANENTGVKRLGAKGSPSQDKLGAASTVIDGEWGESVNGVQVRLRPEKPTWKWGETPTFVLDIRNGGDRAIGVTKSQSAYQVTFQGKWYGRSELENIEDDTIKPGETRAAAVRIVLEQNKWNTTGLIHTEPGELQRTGPKPGESLRLIRSGRYTIRAASFHPFDFEREFRDDKEVKREKLIRPGQKDIRAVSNPVEIEIRPSPENTTEDVAWGKAVHRLARTRI